MERGEMSSVVVKRFVSSSVRAMAFVAASLLVVVGAGCSDDKASDDGANDAGGNTGVDAGERLTPPLELGEAIDAPADTWTWVDFPETRCMDDSATGLGIKLRDGADKALIVIQGGGACFSTTTCLAVANQNGFGKANLTSSVEVGLLDADDQDNPFRDWNMVFIPYCSGDIFSGSAKDGSGYEGRTQIGYQNIREYLKRLVPTFANMKQIVLSGYSAGGFAASVNWVQALEGFGEDVRIDVLNDSGPTMGPKYLTPCLQQRLAQVWNWAPSIPKGCTDCDIETGNVTEPVIKWAMDYTRNYRHGIISSDEDSVIKIFYGAGLNDCANIDGFATFPNGLYAEGLADLRKMYKDEGYTEAAMYVVKSSAHVWTMQSPGAVTSNGVVLRDWIEDFLDPTAEWKDVVP